MRSSSSKKRQDVYYMYYFREQGSYNDAPNAKCWWGALKSPWWKRICFNAMIRCLYEDEHEIKSSLLAWANRTVCLTGTQYSFISKHILISLIKSALFVHCRWWRTECYDDDSLSEIKILSMIVTLFSDSFPQSLGTYRCSEWKNAFVMSLSVWKDMMRNLGRPTHWTLQGKVKPLVNQQIILN